MTKYLEENERIKRDFAMYLQHAKGQDGSSIDKTRAARVKDITITSWDQVYMYVKDRLTC
jgi:hypothetical protein